MTPFEMVVRAILRKDLSSVRTGLDQIDPSVLDMPLAAGVAGAPTLQCRTLLGIAAEFGSLPMVLELLRQGAAASGAPGCATPVAVAIANERDDVLYVLLAAGANISEPPDGFPTFAHFLVSVGTPACARSLARAGVSLDEPDSNGSTALLSLIQEECDPHLAEPNTDAIAMLEELLRLGADPERANSTGDTPLRVAEQSGMRSRRVLLPLLTARRTDGR